MKLTTLLLIFSCVFTQLFESVSGFSILSKLEEIFDEKPNEKTQPTEPPSKVYTLEFDFVGRMGREFFQDVVSNSIVKVRLAKGPNDNGNWTVSNIKAIEEVPERIEYLGAEYIDYHDDDSCQRIHFPTCSMEVFSFLIKDPTKGLPNLFFFNKNYFGQSVVLRYIEEPLDLPINKFLIEDNLKKEHEFTFETECYAVFQFKGNYSTGYSWELENYYNLKNESIELVELKEVDYKVKKDCKVSGCPDLKSFKFHIKEVNKSLPKLNFVYRRSIDAFDEKKVIVTLKGKP